ncbi:alkylation response protein AidB-like acyl-CoA dehydrogenase [Salinibacter ruber]|uniref:hypothetical protein n=1 Tax=Salinibacter ruber TaxID=146919 RepID=UPI0021698A85|nr:hypothetical protein [Salinibacter ruber]MCS3827436.1 alkylation response protein AidB-like acyl-CoA dehydrogenase [Salinibacter ruber]
MATKSTALRNSQADDMAANLNALEISDSTGPTVIIEFTGVSFGAASSGTVNATSTPHSGSAAASGDADQARLYDAAGSTGEEVNGLTVTETGGGGDIELDNTNINSGQTVEITSIDITEPSNTQ